MSSSPVTIKSGKPRMEEEQEKVHGRSFDPVHIKNPFYKNTHSSESIPACIPFTQIHEKVVSAESLTDGDGGTH